MRFCAGKASATSSKVGIHIQVTQSFWIVVPPTFVQTLEILYPDTPDYVAAVGHASMWKHKRQRFLARLRTLLIALLALLIALLALLACTRRCGQAWGCASFRPQTLHPSFPRSGFKSSRSRS